MCNDKTSQTLPQSENETMIENGSIPQAVSQKDPIIQALNEYELAVKAQMHFNEILMKFRSFGIAVVIAVYSYAITRKELAFSDVGGLSPAQLIAMAGVALTCVLAIIDIFYFFPLLLGAVARSTKLEEIVSYRLTSTITSQVSKARSYFLIICFYIVIALLGIGLIFCALQEPKHDKKSAIEIPAGIKTKPDNVSKNLRGN